MTKLSIIPLIVVPCVIIFRNVIIHIILLKNFFNITIFIVSKGYVFPVFFTDDVISILNSVQ